MIYVCWKVKMTYPCGTPWRWIDQHGEFMKLPPHACKMLCCSLSRLCWCSCMSWSARMQQIKNRGASFEKIKLARNQRSTPAPVTNYVLNMSGFFIVNVHFRQKPSEPHKILQPLIPQSFWQRFSLASWSSTFNVQIPAKNWLVPKELIRSNLGKSAYSSPRRNMSGFNYTFYKLFGVRWFAFSK